MPLKKDETRITVTQAELSLLIGLLPGPTTRLHSSLWKKVSAASYRLYGRNCRDHNCTNSAQKEQ